MRREDWARTLEFVPAFWRHGQDAWYASPRLWPVVGASVVAAIGAASASIAGRPAYFVVLVFSAVFAYTACGLWASMQGGEWISLKGLIKQLTDFKLDGEVIRFSLLRPEASATIPSPELLLEDWREHVRVLFDTHLRLRSYRNHVLDDSGDRISKPLETLDLVLSELKQLYRP